MGDEQNRDLTEAIETIDRRSRNLLTFIENFKTLSQIPKPQMELLQVKELINRISVLMSSYVEHSNATLQCDVKDEQLMIFADSAQIEQILINLIKNSIEAAASEILVRVEANTDSKIILAVKDNGSGFSTESATKACIPFYTTKPEGSGLGLSIVRQIMHLHGGEVKIDSDDRGSEITLLFP